MAKDWDYAQLTKAAAEAGGPEVWIDAIKKAAYNSGASDTKNALIGPLLIVGTALGVASTFGYQKIRKWISSKKEEELLTEKEAEQAEALLKEELDTAIKTHTDNGDPSSETVV